MEIPRKCKMHNEGDCLCKKMLFLYFKSKLHQIKNVKSLEKFCLIYYALLRHKISHKWWLLQFKKVFFEVQQHNDEKIPFWASYFAPSKRCTHIGMLYTVGFLDQPLRSMKNSIFFKTTHAKAEPWSITRAHCLWAKYSEKGDYIDSSIPLLSPKIHHIYGTRCEKTCLQGFRPGLTQTGLYSHRRYPETWNFVFRK